MLSYKLMKQSRFILSDDVSLGHMVEAASIQTTHNKSPFEKKMASCG